MFALNKSDLTEKKKTEIDVKKLSEKLGCPVIQTVSTTSGHLGLKEVVNQAVALKNGGQKAPYLQEDIDLQDKAQVEAADRKRFAFVNEIVKAVEKRKVLTKDKNKQDSIDSVLTNKFIGIPVFAAIMFGVFYISQSTVGTWIADWLVGWIETFQGWVAGLVENASPFLQALLVDGIIGGVGAVVGFLPLVMVMYFLIALLEDCGYMARATVVLDPIFKRVGLSGKSCHSYGNWYRMCHSWNRWLAVPFETKESEERQLCLHHLCRVEQNFQLLHCLQVLFLQMLHG